MPVKPKGKTTAKRSTGARKATTKKAAPRAKKAVGKKTTAKNSRKAAATGTRKSGTAASARKKVTSGRKTTKRTETKAVSSAVVEAVEPEITATDIAPMDSITDSPDILIREEVVPSPLEPVADSVVDEPVETEIETVFPEQGISPVEDDSVPDISMPEPEMSTESLKAVETPKEETAKVGEVQLVCFSMNEIEFGVDIHRVQEIKRIMAITSVPDCPPYARGIINLRGQVIPIIELRTRMGYPEAEHDRQTRIVVLDNGGQLTGIIVDNVTKVLRIDGSQIVDTPELASTPGREFLQGIFQQDNKLILVLDCDKVLDFSN